MNKTRLSRLMKLSWRIQKTKRITRAKALQSAWAIFSNEDITIQYLTLKLNHHKPTKGNTHNQFSLFNKI